ncbi:MAG: 3-deoxy-D-arabinoheptulosonate-7-phosphate synthase [Candidatus Eremiobacteraeota bacterium]|nr:3-deoxy-D-arabinoheptulosonate-7-phosphate synthase [Candidatus Eremiobacteraeota bacterium]
MTIAQPATGDPQTPSLTLTAAFEGIEGSYSHAVLDAYAARRGVTFAPLGCSSFRAVAHAVLSGKADLGLLPIDNAIAGTIREGYDVLAEYELDLLAEITWRMDHRLLSVAGATLEGLREIDSHPVVLAECGRFLGTLADVRRVPVPDTGVAARDVAAAGDLTRGAIASADAARRYGLVELANTIADHPDNFTRFVLFRAPKAVGLAAEFEPAQDFAVRKTSLVFAVADTPGALGRCLSIIGAHGLNISKLDSKTRLGANAQSSFYVDVDGDVRDERFAEALRALRDVTVALHVIGTYDASSAPARPRREPGVVVDQSPAVTPKPAKSSNSPKASRQDANVRSRVMVGDVVVGDGNFVVIGGPCSVESREQIIATAESVSHSGAVMLRGGAFKPRTSPYAFQGLGWEGVALLAEAGRATGLPVVSEVMSVEQVERMSASVDLLQIGARNMQNFDLLKAVGKTQRPILLKRGMAASIDELLSAAEYILAEGNPNVILCERGIRTFETSTRNTLDLSAVPVLRERTHLPVLVDPSHGVGVRRWIVPLCRAAKAVGAHGLLIEVHPNPSEAKCDADQALTFGDFAELMEELSRIPQFAPPPLVR